MAAHVLRRFLRDGLAESRSPSRVFALNSSKRRCEGAASDKGDDGEDDVGEVHVKKRIFSGIQPTGCLHLGNYFGAVSQWIDMQNANEDVLVSIVDMHSITMPQNAEELRNNVLQMTACLLACGIDADKCTLFQQSRVHQHVELAWVLSCLTTIARLNRLPQYKEKTSKLKEIPLGLFIYPVLQSADILLYKTTHVPVGEDQLQHIQLAKHLARVFNNTHGPYFPSPKAILGDDTTSRVKSLRDPAKKMSKSDPDPRSRIELTDSDEAIVEKFRKAVTDFTSAVTYDPEGRPAVSGLINIECLLTGKSPQRVCEEAAGLETARYKLRLADAVVHRLRPIRSRIQDLMKNGDHLEKVLKRGSEKASVMAEETWTEVRKMVGLS